MGSVLGFFKGHIKVRLISNSPERFLNICNANEIKIWNLLRTDEDYFFYIYPEDFFSLKGILKKTGSKTIILEKQGLFFTLFRYRKHNCFIAGILLAFFMIYIISLFIWDISVEGNMMITDDVIMDSLEIYGIKHGEFKNNIVCDDLEKYLRNNFNDMTWVSAEIDGTRLTIYVKENDEDFVEDADVSLCDITATKAGVIEAIVTRSGTPLVKPGDTVEAGDILVSGIVNVMDDGGNIVDTKQVCSDADIIIRTQYDYVERLNKKYVYKLFTGRESKKYYLKVLDKRVTVGFNPGYDSCENLVNDSQIKLNENFFLPVHYGSIKYTEYKEESAFYTVEQAKEVLDGRFNYFLAELEEKGVQIISKDVKMYEYDFEYTYSGPIIMLEPACQKSPIFVENMAGEHESMGEVNERN